MFCPSCGNQLPDNAKFCNSCGTSLVSQATPSPQQLTPGAAPTYSEHVTPYMAQPTYQEPKVGKLKYLSTLASKNAKTTNLISWIVCAICVALLTYGFVTFSSPLIHESRILEIIISYDADEPKDNFDDTRDESEAYREINADIVDDFIEALATDLATALAISIALILLILSAITYIVLTLLTVLVTLFKRTGLVIFVQFFSVIFTFFVAGFIPAAILAVAYTVLAVLCHIINKEYKQYRRAI